jgi:6-phosphogluconolactonase
VNGTVRLVDSVEDAFAARVVEAFAAPREGGFSLFLSGGPTAGRAYARLADTAGDTVDWGSVDAWWGDERCVPLDSPDSNHRLCHETLLDRVGPTRSDHPMYVSGEPEDAAAAYQAALAPLDVFDLVHLGMGPDGHCASLFPDAPTLAIDDPDVLAVATRDPKANNPHDRITLTYPAIARARLVVFTVSGESKRDAFARVVAGEPLPAARVTAGEVLWLVDADAAGDTPLP